MVLGSPTKRDNLFAYRTITFCGYPFQSIRLKIILCNSLAPSCRNRVESHDPAYTTHTSLHVGGLGCSPFARRYWGNRGCFLFL